MKKQTLKFFPIIILFLFSSLSGNAQFLIGAQLAGVDSNPLPNVAAHPFIGYQGDLDSWLLKFTVGYLQTGLAAREDKTRTVFSGALINISPEFILTPERENPFKMNVGISGYYGNYYQQETTFLPGGSVGFAWGFGTDYTDWELLGTVHLLGAKEKEGTSQGPLHTMAMFGVLRKF